MIVAVIGDSYEGYWLDEDVKSWPTQPHIDVTQKFFERYKSYEAEQEFIQSKLHRYSEDARTQEVLNKSKTGIPAKGFT